MLATLMQTTANISIVILAAAAVGLIVNTIAVLGVAWKGGHILGRLEQSVNTLATEVVTLRQRGHEHANILTRVVAQLDGLERRVEVVETAVLLRREKDKNRR